MNGRIDSRLRPEAWQYFTSRMLEWNLTSITETIHRIISEHEVQKAELYRLELEIRRLQSIIDKQPSQALRGKCLIRDFTVSREECLACQTKNLETQCPKIKPFISDNLMRQDNFAVMGIDSRYPPPKPAKKS